MTWRTLVRERIASGTPTTTLQSALPPKLLNHGTLLVSLWSRCYEIRTA